MARNAPLLKSDTLGGFAATALILSALSYPIVGRLVDGLVVITDPLGRNQLITSSSFRAYIGTALTIAAIMASLLTFRKQHRPPTPQNSLFAFAIIALVTWWAILSAVIPRTTDRGLPYYLSILGSVPLLIGAVRAPPTRLTVHRVNSLRDIFGVATVVYTVAFPELAQLPCRPDKCGILGTMGTGFYWQENTSVLALSLLLPTVSMSNPFRVAFSSGIAFLVALISGSRTGLLATAIAVFVSILLYERKERSGTTFSGHWKNAVSLTVFALPFCASATAVVLFLVAKPDFLTYRGSVYAANKGSLRLLNAWIGVPWDTVAVATGGYLSDDHSQASYILAKAGIVGLFLWMSAMLLLFLRRRRSQLQKASLGILAAGAVSMITESTFELECRSLGFAALLLAVGLSVADTNDDYTEAREFVRVLYFLRRQMPRIVIVASVPIIMVNLLPATYEAHSSVIVASDDRGQISSGSASVAHGVAASLTTLVNVQGAITGTAGADPHISSLAAASTDVVAERADGTAIVRVTTTSSTLAEATQLNGDLVRRLVLLANNAARAGGNEYHAAASPLYPSIGVRVSPWSANWGALLMYTMMGWLVTLIASYYLRNRRVWKRFFTGRMRPSGKHVTIVN